MYIVHLLERIALAQWIWLIIGFFIYRLTVDLFSLETHKKLRRLFVAIATVIPLFVGQWEEIAQSHGIYLVMMYLAAGALTYFSTRKTDIPYGKSEITFETPQDIDRVKLYLNTRYARERLNYLEDKEHTLIYLQDYWPGQVIFFKIFPKKIVVIGPSIFLSKLKVYVGDSNACKIPVL